MVYKSIYSKEKDAIGCKCLCHFMYSDSLQAWMHQFKCADATRFAMRDHQVHTNKHRPHFGVFVLVLGVWISGINLSHCGMTFACNASRETRPELLIAHYHIIPVANNSNLMSAN